MTADAVQPVFVDRKTAAAMLMISVDTFNMWLQQGFIPPAHINRGQIIRWHWPSVEKKLAGTDNPTQIEPVRRIMPEGPYVRPKRQYKRRQPTP